MNEEYAEGFIVSTYDMRDGVIFCHDCKEQIVSVADYVKERESEDIIGIPLSEQFQGHIDHKISIIVKVHFYNFGPYFQIFDAMIKEANEKQIH